MVHAAGSLSRLKRKRQGEALQAQHSRTVHSRSGRVARVFRRGLPIAACKSRAHLESRGAPPVPAWRPGQRIVPSDASITCEVLTCATSERGPNAKGLMVMKKSTFRNEPMNKFHFIPDAPCRISSRRGRFPLAAIRVAAARCRNEPISRSHYNPVAGWPGGCPSFAFREGWGTDILSDRLQRDPCVASARLVCDSKYFF